MDGEYYLLYDETKGLNCTSLLKCRAIKSDNERERGNLHLEVQQIKSNTKLIFQKCGPLVIIKERYMTYTVNLGKIFLYVTYFIMRKLKAW